jgi:hypothetical protein
MEERMLSPFTGIALAITIAAFAMNAPGRVAALLKHPRPAMMTVNYPLPLQPALR